MLIWLVCTFVIVPVLLVTAIQIHRYGYLQWDEYAQAFFFAIHVVSDSATIAVAFAASAAGIALAHVDRLRLLFHPANFCLCLTFAWTIYRATGLGYS